MINDELEAGTSLCTLGTDGLDLIKESEGYHREQTDGSCVAYLCPAGVPTIGWGCTRGVRLGMRWTREEAEEALKRELRATEDAVTRAVTVSLSQQQFDALVSFTYNVGEGNLRRSTLLKKLNRGDYDGAAEQFAVWNKARVNGKLTVLPGLVTRRRREGFLFASGTMVAHEVAHVEGMPQEVAENRPSTTVAAMKLGGPPVAAAAAASVATPPEGTWDTTMTMATKMASFAGSHWQTVAAIGGVTALLWFLPRLTGNKQ